MTKVIAEIGINWSGDLMIAQDMIFLSARAGVDFVKFQMFNSEVIKGSKYESELSEMILLQEHIQCLSDKAKANNVGFGISVMYKEGFDILDQLNPHSIQFIKIRHADRYNSELAKRAINYCNENQVDLLVSCSNLDEVCPEYIDSLANQLYCIPKYPPELDEISFEEMELFEGYSNHFPSKYILMLAVTRHLEYIEIHVKRKTRNSKYGCLFRYTIEDQQLDENVSIDFYDLEEVCKFKNIADRFD